MMRFALLLIPIVWALLIGQMLFPFVHVPGARIWQLSFLAPLAVGTSSLAYFVSFAFTDFSYKSILLVDTALTLLIVLLWLLTRQRERIVSHTAAFVLRWPDRVAYLSAAVVFLLATSSTFLLSTDNPMGFADAYAIWNLRALLLAVDGPLGGNINHLDLFRNPWVWHGDYPLALPAATAHFWRLLGFQWPEIPASIAAAFLYSTAGVLFSLFRLLGNVRTSILASTLVLASPLAVYVSASQCADVPLGFFVVATFGCLVLSANSALQTRALMTSGICAGAAAWLKNEGSVFCAVVAGLVLVAFTAQERSAVRALRRMLPFAVGLAPFLAVLVYFKFFLAPPNDLLRYGGFRAADFFSLERHATVLKTFGGTLLNAGSFVLSGPILWFLYTFAHRAVNNDVRSSMGTVLIGATAICVMGYYMIFLSSPWELNYHLATASKRLVLHWWPAFVLIMGLLTTNWITRAERIQ